MDQAPNTEDGTDEPTMTPLEMRRARLRAFADGLMEKLETISKPDSFIEIERAGRAAMVIDRLMAQLYAAPVKAPTPAQSPYTAFMRAASRPAQNRLEPQAPSPFPAQQTQTPAEDRGTPDVTDSEDSLMDDVALAAWEERFINRVMGLAEDGKQGVPLPPGFDDLLGDMQAQVDGFATPPP